MDKPADGIDREHVESSMIESMGYDPGRRILAVEFRNGAIFHYNDVPVDMAAEFYGSLSKGQYFNGYIRKKFNATKMTGPCAQCGAQGVIGEECDSCGTSRHMREETRYGEPKADT